MLVEFQRAPSFDANFGSRYEQEFDLEKDIKRVLGICDRELGINVATVTLESCFVEEGKYYSLVGGNTFSAKRLAFYFLENPQHPVRSVRKDLVAAIAHEYAHAARRKLFSDSRYCLWQAVVNEGVSIHFQRRIFPKLRTVEQFVPDNSVKKILTELAQDRSQVEMPLRGKWIYGEGGLPNAALYKAGEVVIGEHIKGNELSLRELLMIRTVDVEMPNI